MDAARKAALETLVRVYRDGAYSNLALSSALGGNLSRADSAFASALVYTTLERQITIDYHLSQYLTQPIRKLRPDVCAALRMGAAQILFMDKVPDSAAVNETVTLVRGNKKTAYAAGLVNAVLRRVAAGGLQIPEGDGDEARSVRYACPVWLVRLWTESYGRADADALMASSLGSSPTIVRVNTLKTTTESLAERLAAEGVQARRFDGLPHALILENAGAPERLKAFRDGLFHVQDAASQYCCEALDVRAGQTVYDVCAAPGGKSFTLCEMMENTGSVYAFDLHAHRVGLIESGAQRLGIRNLHAAVHDACALDGDRAKADRVLCDVPCSGLGVIGKKPEIRLKSAQEVDNLHDIQYNILCVCSTYVKKGGRLVYSTCSLNPRENEDVVRRFLQTHPAFRTVPVLQNTDKLERDNMCTLMPHRSGSDGFFITALSETE